MICNKYLQLRDTLQSIQLGKMGSENTVKNFFNLFENRRLMTANVFVHDEN